MMDEEELQAMVRLLRAAKDRALLEHHDHPSDILVDVVRCKVCWAEHELLMAARARLLAVRP